MQEPKRIQASQPKFELPNDEKFELPMFELNLDFLLSRGNEDFTVQSLIQKALGDVGERLTPPEQVYVIVNALKDLEIVAPLEFECQHCNSKNPIAIELAKVMEYSGESKSKFFISFNSLKNNENKYIFEFHRPEKILDVTGVSSSLASVGVFLIQWLEAHNQGEAFDVTKMPIRDFVELVKLFGEKMFDVQFKTEFKCAKCKKKNQQDFSIGMQELVDVLNEL